MGTETKRTTASTNRRRRTRLTWRILESTPAGSKKSNISTALIRAPLTKAGRVNSAAPSIPLPSAPTFSAKRFPPVSPHWSHPRVQVMRLSRPWRRLPRRPPLHPRRCPARSHLWCRARTSRIHPVDVASCLTVSLTMEHLYPRLRSVPQNIRPSCISPINTHACSA